MQEGGEDARPTRTAKTVWLDPDTHRPLMRLKVSRGFRSLDGLIRDTLRVYLSLANPDDVSARRKYAELVRRACKEMGSDARSYPTLLLKRYRGEIARRVKAYILARQDEEVFCFLVLEEGGKGSA